MAADLHIHVYSQLDQTKAIEAFRCFFANTIGSKYGPKMDEVFTVRETSKCDDLQCEHREFVYGCESVWIGEVSWLKAGLLEDADTYIPNTVAKVQEIVDDPGFTGEPESNPIIDDSFIEEIVKAFDQPNNTVKEGGVWSGKGYSLADPKEVKEFLEKHKGKRTFTISW